MIASAANRDAWTILSTPAGAKGTSSAGAKSTASDTRTATANAPRDSGPWTSRAGRTGRSEPVEVGLDVGTDDGQTGLLTEQLGRHLSHLVLVDGDPLADPAPAAGFAVLDLVPAGFPCGAGTVQATGIAETSQPVRLPVFTP